MGQKWDFLRIFKARPHFLSKICYIKGGTVVLYYAHLHLLDYSSMYKNRIIAVSLSLIVIFMSLKAVQAVPQERYFAYILAPKTALTINEEEVKNTSSSEAKLVFQQEAKEVIQIAPDQVGQRVISNTYSIDLRKDAIVTVEGGFQLNAGSIHVKTLEGTEEPSSIMVGQLKLKFSSAEFIAYVSGDGSESVIKAIEGGLSLENPDTQQTADLKALEGTSTDEEGRLLIPFPVEVEQNGAWWNANAYQHDIPEVPIADAGDDQQALNNIAVVLDGSRSVFETGDIFEWKLVSAPKGSDGQEIEKVSFNTLNIVKPVFTPKVSGEYLFSLQITDPEGVTSNLSYVTISIGKEYLTPTVLFPDVPEDHPNNLAITYLYKKNVMRGSEDPDTGVVVFRPEDTINRVEILKTIFENQKLEIPVPTEDDELFLDVKADHWFAPYVLLAKEKGIIKGNDGLYRPADQVLLVEAVKIIVEAEGISIDGYKDETSTPYTDVESGAWYNPYLFFVKKYNLIDADKNGNIFPGKPLTRAEFAEIIFRLESSNLQEKRGFVSGKVLDQASKSPLPNAEVFAYKTVGDSEDVAFLEKGELYSKTTVSSTGSFSMSLPIHHKFYLEAITDTDISVNKVIIQVQEDEVETVELFIKDE